MTCFDKKELFCNRKKKTLYRFLISISFHVLHSVLNVYQGHKIGGLSHKPEMKTSFLFNYQQMTCCVCRL